ncbi:hypothetical protein F9C07_13411 [Aspergillus flavus]|uniref:Uncharacterized protein n=1 Tax=Aspergillus flavus (strain ATCC 200026 / FGSC A1120 / IAM 13836 / NRRL 3357 / JCM 12722 / SRRC 167) TaxID=332952 RepID=A0A7U2MY99_ASPFN|nr:hypothetical protein F9C07_13411 [Aspergillus flavus]
MVYLLLHFIVHEKGSSESDNGSNNWRHYSNLVHFLAYGPSNNSLVSFLWPQFFESRTTSAMINWQIVNIAQLGTLDLLQNHTEQSQFGAFLLVT